MKDISVNENLPSTVSGATTLNRLARRMVMNRLRGVRFGRLTLQEPDGVQIFGDRKSDLEVKVRVVSPQFYADLAYGGSIGAAESYMEGNWSCENLTALIQLFARNQDLLDQMEGGSAALMMPVRKLMHWMNRNTIKGSQRNIAAHYDLGNDFFRMFLDRNMMYSSAVFEHDEMTLDEASDAKLRRVCEKLELGPQDHVLEIGSGWGGFALYAAQNYGCKITTVTISREQFEFAKHRIQSAGLDDQIEIRLQDYREIDGKYDKLVSIEMVEAIGHQFLGGFFNRCSDLLKDHGSMLLQAITIADQRYDYYRKNVDFIQKYIFPGGFLPSIEAMSGAISRNTNLRMFHLEDIGPDYAKTLNEWNKRFGAQRDKITAAGYPESFQRKWEFYFCYCEGAFIERVIGTVQMMLIKPGNRQRPVLEI